jgi:hypothetical protein
LGVLQASDRGLLIASESTLAEAIRAKFASLRDEPEAQKTYLHDSLMEVAAVYAGLVDRK